MAKYDIRDLLGHWVKLPPKSNREGMCPHACCKGRRPHPDRFPVLFPRGLVRHMSDDELVAHFQKPAVGESGAAVTQVTRELERRDRAAARKERARGRRASRNEEYALYLEHAWTKAEADTKGYMLNKRGRAAGIDPRSLWTANERTRAAYASVELRQHWDQHPIISASEFRSEAGQHRGARARRESRLHGVY